MKEKKLNKNIYYVYIIECVGKRLYTGITTDYKRRFFEHLETNKKGAKFTRSFKPIKIRALWTTMDRSNASKLEYQIKKLEKNDKLSLIKNNKLFDYYFSNILNAETYKRQKRF